MNSSASAVKSAAVDAVAVLGEQALEGELVLDRHAGSPRMRRAMRLRWICDVPPMTLWARL